LKLEQVAQLELSNVREQIIHDNLVYYTGSDINGEEITAFRDASGKTVLTLQKDTSLSTHKLSNYNEKYFLISHAGIGYLPKDLSKIASYTFIHSNGKYEDEIDEWWEKNEGIKNPNIYQIHAHRNIQKLSIHPFEHSFNLCDNVEFGGDLRILEIIKNSVK
jgi:hypothetical protein